MDLPHHHMHPVHDLFQFWTGLVPTLNWKYFLNFLLGHQPRYQFIIFMGLIQMTQGPRTFELVRRTWPIAHLHFRRSFLLDEALLNLTNQLIKNTRKIVKVIIQGLIFNVVLFWVVFPRLKEQIVDDNFDEKYANKLRLFQPPIHPQVVVGIGHTNYL